MRRAPTGSARRPGRCARRGSAYVLVLMVSAIVAIIGLSAVTLARVERRRNQGAVDAIKARAAARAAVEFGFLRIRSETVWANLGSGSANWATDVPIAGGKFSLTRTAYDNTDPVNDRLTLLAVGKCGTAVYQLQVVIVRGAWVDTAGWTRVVN